jgi:hypothetical protein
MRSFRAGSTACSPFRRRARLAASHRQTRPRPLPRGGTRLQPARGLKPRLRACVPRRRAKSRWRSRSPSIWKSSASRRGLPPRIANYDLGRRNAEARSRRSVDPLARSDFDAVHRACQFGEHGGLVPEAGGDFRTVSSGRSSSKSVITATMNGCEIVFSNPIGTGMSS